MKKLTKNILLLLNLAVAIALCFAYLSNIVNPANLWQFSFFGLAYPIFLLLNVGFVIFWSWRKKKAVFISLVCILIGFGNIGRYFQLRIASTAENTDQNIKTISYNVRVFNHFDWEEGTSVRDSILSYLENESADIICLQEFLTREKPESQSENYVKQKLTNTPNTHINYSYKINQNSTHAGLATFSKFPIVRRGVILFENSPNSCIYSDIINNSDTFRVYNLHLQSFKLKLNDANVIDSIFHINHKRLNDLRAVSSRLKQAFIKRSDQVESVVQHMKDSPYPLILCGDFNDTPVSHTYHSLLGNKKDAFREAGSGVSRTYKGKLPSYRIDYVFYSDIFKAISYKTGQENLSDHCPVITLLQPRKLQKED